jgi:hypothetical protein
MARSFTKIFGERGAVGTAAHLKICDIRSIRSHQKNKMPDVDLAIRHPALQSMCSKD